MCQGMGWDGIKGGGKGGGEEIKERGKGREGREEEGIEIRIGWGKMECPYVLTTEYEF